MQSLIRCSIGILLKIVIIMNNIFNRNPIENAIINNIFNRNPIENARINVNIFTRNPIENPRYS